MKLKSLEIEEIPSYEDNAGQYRAKMKYHDKTGNVELVLEPDVSTALLACCGDVIAAFTKQAALKLQTNVLQSVAEAKALPAINTEESV